MNSKNTKACHYQRSQSNSLNLPSTLEALTRTLVNELKRQIAHFLSYTLFRCIKVLDNRRTSSSPVVRVGRSGSEDADHLDVPDWHLEPHDKICWRSYCRTALGLKSCAEVAADGSVAKPVSRNMKVKVIPYLPQLRHF